MKPHSKRTKTASAALKAVRTKQEEGLKAVAAQRVPGKMGADGKPLPAPKLPELTPAEVLAMKPVVRHCMSVTREDVSEIIDGKETGRKLQVEKCADLADGKYYNPVFPGGQISMTPPLSDDRVSYSDGTKPTQEQLSRDVVTFLQWAAEPEMEQRKSMGVKAILFLLIASGFLYAAKRRVWRNVHARREDEYYS